MKYSNITTTTTMGDLLMILAAMLSIIFVVQCRSWKARRNMSRLQSRSSRLPRGNLGWPLIGETFEFVSCAYSPRPESFMEKRRLMYGKVFKSHVFGAPTIVSTDPEVSRVVLQSDAQAFVPWYPKSLTELMGKSSIIAINGSLHRRVHGLIGSFFKSAHLKAQITRDMQRYVRDSMASWSDDQLIHIQTEAKHIVFKILVKGLIGLEPGEEMRALKQHFQEFIAGLMSVPIKLPGGQLYRSLQAKKKMVSLVHRIIQEKRKSGGCGEQSPPQDVIDVLMNDTSGLLTDDHIMDNMIDLMIPAEDSVPVLITLAVKYLTDCPLALQLVEEENMELKRRRDGCGEELQWTDYGSLSFTQDVITETLRIGNIITGIMRKAVRDVEIKGHLIPKGWCVFTYFRSVHLDETLYEDPHKFNPWRWKGKDVGTFGYTPFGGGQRLCPGVDLARLEASIFLHHLVTEFTWLAEEDRIVSFPTVRLKGGMPVRGSGKREPTYTKTTQRQTGPSESQRLKNRLYYEAVADLSISTINRKTPLYCL